MTNLEVEELTAAIRRLPDRWPFIAGFAHARDKACAAEEHAEAAMWSALACFVASVDDTERTAMRDLADDFAGVAQLVEDDEDHEDHEDDGGEPE